MAAPDNGMAAIVPSHPVPDVNLLKLQCITAAKHRTVETIQQLPVEYSTDTQE
jgi:hypothetical protein